jgi:hypothetical protein
MTFEVVTAKLLRIQVFWDVTVLLGEWFLTFQLFYPKRQLTLEDKGNIILQNIRNH